MSPQGFLNQTILRTLFSYSLVAPVIVCTFFASVEKIPSLEPWFERFENITVYSRMRARAVEQAPPDPRLFIIGVDDGSIKHLDARWPFSWEQHHTPLISLLNYQPPAVMAWDVLFLERPVMPEGSLIAPDKLFANAISSASYPTVLAAHIAAQQPRPEDYSSGWGFPGHLSRKVLLDHPHLDVPVKHLRDSAHTGVVDVDQALDGVVVRKKLFIRSGNEIVPSLALKTLMEYWGLKPSQVRIELNDAVYLENDLIKRRIPINHMGEYLINYRYEKDDFQDNKGAAPYGPLLTSLEDQYRNGILHPNLPDTRSKIVMVGMMSTGLGDSGPTPFSGNSPRPLVHMNIMDNILKEDYLTSFTGWKFWVSFALFTALTLNLARIAHFWVAISIPPVVAVSYVISSFIIFDSMNLMIPLVFPMIAFLLVHTGAIIQQVVLEQRARKELRNTFSAYVSSNIMQAIYDDASNLQLGGAQKEVAILFSDIRKFTTMTEMMDSTSLVRQLNEYFTDMVDCINGYDGTLHKFIGDAIMAVWGDISYAGPANDAGQSVRAAIAMRKKIRELNHRWVANGRPEFNIGIGINHGKVTVGNIGAPQRMEFTVIGDAVNLASRLEGLTKQFGIEIIVGETVHNLTFERFAFRPLGKVRVVGKTVPVAIYEPLYELDSPNDCPYDMDWLRLYEEAFTRFEEERFDLAARIFEACLHEYPQDKACQIFLDRSRDLSEKPPAPDWDGALELTRK